MNYNVIKSKYNIITQNLRESSYISDMYVNDHGESNTQSGTYYRKEYILNVDLKNSTYNTKRYFGEQLKRKVGMNLSEMYIDNTYEVYMREENNKLILDIYIS